MYAYEFVTPANKFINTMAGVFHAHPRMTGVVFALHTAVWALIAFAGWWGVEVFGVDCGCAVVFVFHGAAVLGVVGRAF